jgi:predicted alpha/beta superfamily hydrolase
MPASFAVALRRVAPLSVVLIGLFAITGCARRGNILEEKLPSTILQENRYLQVRLPPGYTASGTTRYPVLFKLDGDNGVERYHDVVTNLSRAGTMPEVIVVAIANGQGQRNRDMTPPSLHQEAGLAEGKMGSGPMGQGDRFLEFMEKELIPLIDRNYRTTGQRILAGHSRSALLVLHSLLTKPELFQARFIFSAPLTRDEQRMIADTKAFLATAPNHRSFVYFNWGEKEIEGMQRSRVAMEALLRERAPAGLKWLIESAPGADHQATPLAAIPRALEAAFTPGRDPARSLNR